MPMPPNAINVALAVLRLVETEKFVVEGGGATGLAALLPGVTFLQVRGAEAEHTRTARAALCAAPPPTARPPPGLISRFRPSECRAPPWR